MSTKNIKSPSSSTHKVATNSSSSYYSPEAKKNMVSTPGSVVESIDRTPDEKGVNVLDNVVYIKNFPIVKNIMVKGYERKLLSITGYNYKGQAYLINYWGESALTMLQVLDISMNQHNNHIYAFQTGESVPLHERSIMFLKEFPPNPFEVAYAKVFKLVCRQGIIDGKLTSIAFLKAKKWPENATLPDGTLLPPPEKWQPTEVDSKFSIEDLAEADDFEAEILSPNKKQKL
jgi:hypothetical protein